MWDSLDLALASISFLSLREKNLLKNNLDSLDTLAVTSIEDISSIVGRTVKSAKWNGKECVRLAEVARKIMDSFGLTAVVHRDSSFPAMLREMYDPPYMLFFRGNPECLDKLSVSVVGTRQICAEAAEKTRDFCRDAALDGRLVISGLAYGVDSWAHKSALLACEKGMSQVTAAVLPCGIDTVIPYGNRKIAEAIIKNGGVLVSEYLPGIGAEPWRFVQRDRLIAAFSPATVVMQAPPGSGALITASFALDYNRELYFHEACFCKDAKELSRRQSERLVAQNTKSAQNKLSHSADSYVAEGAAVIKNYEDFVHALENGQGIQIKQSQMGLFDQEKN
ncbi:MAG: DNA-protecting protein DprA [Treponema sp.]|nr:DNA-protecting protein DprA [Treponema sp.]